MKRILLILILLSSYLWAQEPSFDVNYPWMTDIREFMIGGDTWGTARSLALSGAIGAIGDNSDVVVVNPALLGLIKRNQFDFNLVYQKQTSDFTYFGSTDGNSNSISRFHFSSLGLIYSYPVYRGSASLALGYLKLKDFTQSNYFSGMTQSANSEEPSLLEINEEDKRGHLGTIYFSGAIQYSPNLYFGATLNFLSGVHDYNFSIRRTDPTNYFGLIDYLRKFDTEDTFSGFNFVLGAVYSVYDIYRFSFAFTSPSWIKVDEKSRSYLWAEDQDAWYFYADDYGDVAWLDSKYDYRLQLPMKLNLAFGYQIKNLSWDIDFSFSDYSQMDYNKDPIEGLDHQRRMNKLYQSSLGLASGLEFRIPRTLLALQLGGEYRSLPYETGREAYLNNSNILEIVEEDGNSNLMAFSLGWLIQIDRNLRFNFAWRYSRWELKEPILTEKFSDQQIGFGVTFRM